jgi:hypothetical protein|tara:strand:- start:74 stop:1906 length:1833 start_codon:yes stop_codon:yes gene_type:complete
MISEIKKNFFFLTLFFVILIIHQIIFQDFFPNSKGFLGHDYEQFIPNFIFGKIWFQNNFLSIPWFSPSFCCGVPFFADPQSMFYSLQQFIFIIFDPVHSIKIIFFTFSLIGYVAMFFLVKRNFNFNNYSSLVCASLFLFNGFFVYRAITGHIAYLSYIFIPLYCFLLIQSLDNKINKSGLIYLILSSIIFANFFHSGSGPIILIIVTSIFFVLLLYAHLNNNLTIFYKFFQSLFLGILISLSKIIASLFFLSNFPRQYPATEFNSFLAYMKNFFLSFFLEPNQNYFNETVKSILFLRVHEMEYSLSIVPLISLLLIFFLDKKYFKIVSYNLRFLLIIFFIFLIPILLNVNFLNQYQLIEKIPILNSTWVQFRWITIYILPIILITGLLIENVKINFKIKKYLSISLILILLIQNFIKDKSWHFDKLSYNVKNSSDFTLKLKEGMKPKINGPALLMKKNGKLKKVNNRNDMFFFSYSPLRCYQPIFGYRLEKLKKKKIIFNSKKVLQDGSLLYYSDKLDENNGELTFFNPTCFLYPKENNCLPGDTFKISEKEKLIKFANYKKFDFKQNKTQVLANYISFFSFLLSILFLLYHFILFIYKFRKKLLNYKFF